MTQESPGATTAAAPAQPAACPAPAAGRRGKLPPSPASTLVRPQQLLQRQRQAERAVAEEDAAALQQALGDGGSSSPRRRGMAAAATKAAAGGDSVAVGAPATGDGGQLTALTLQALLPGASLQQQQQQGGMGEGGLGAKPSVLTAYITGLADQEGAFPGSSLQPRQLMQLQGGGGPGSSSSGGPGRGAAPRGLAPPPPALASSRHAPGRREVFVLSKWLEVETARFNATYARKDERTPLVDFLILAATKAKAIYSQAYAELARQVTQHCEERGRLMADVWIGYSTMLDSVLSRVHAAYAVVKDRAERAEVRLELAEGQLAQERESSEAYKTELQDEVARLRAELTAALSMGGGGSHVDVMSAVLGPQRGSESAAAESGGMRRLASLREGGREGSVAVGPGGRSVRFRDSHFSPLARGSTAVVGGGGKRGTMAAEELRQGSRRASAAMSSVMRQLQDTAGSTLLMGTSGGLSGEDAEALQAQNNALKDALDSARQELFEVYKQLADLEAAANEVVLLESRAEAAENERDEALSQLRATTPRPAADWNELQGLVGEQGVLRFQAALDAHKQWPTDDLAQLLVGGLLHAASDGSGTGASRDAGAADAAAGTGSTAGSPAQGAPQGPGSAGGSAPGSPALAAEGSAASTVGGGSGAPSRAGVAPGPPGPESHLSEHVGQALGCLRVAVSTGLLSRDDIRKAISERNVAALADAADDEEHVEWLAFALSRPPADPEALLDFLAGSTRGGQTLSPSFYGCMQQYREGMTFDEARTAVQRARMSTKTRVAMLEEEVRAAQQECKELRSVVQAYKDVEQRRDAARRRREEEAQLEKKSPLQQYVELLGSQDEAAWKEWLIGMGQSADVPKLFKHSGRIRNKNLSKRDTEKLVKEIWKERMADPAAAAGKAIDLLEFVFQQLQKKVGIINAVVEAGYNFLFGLWKYQWDADCELFLRIMLGEVKEDVYVAQIRLQEEVEELFAAIDRAKGQATGTIAKEDLRTTFLAFFKVGQPGGKTLKRFDELMQAMDEDQEGDTVEWRKVFEEDREFNQGEFAEAIRDQFLQERVEFFKALEEALYEEAHHEEECTKEHAVQALLRVDLDMSEKAAQQTAAAIFSGGLDLLSIKAVMRKLSRGVVRRGRASSTKGSVMGVAALKGGKAGKKANAPSEACLRALEALRQEWIARELQRGSPAGGKTG